MPPFLVRPIRPADAPTVAEFFAGAHRADPEVQFVPLAAWRAFAAYPANNRAKDFRVAEVRGRIAGVLTSTLIVGTRRGRRRRHFRIIVHPEFRGRGIGEALLAEAAAQPLPPPRPTLQSLCPGTWSLALRFLRRRGFKEVHRDLEMERPPRRVPASGEAAAVRPFGRPGDADAWIRLHEEGYRSDFHFEPLTRASVRAEVGTPGTLVLVAEAAGRPVGVVLAREHDRSRASIQSLLVARRRRRRGVGRGLLQAALAGMAARGRRRCSLGVVEDNAAALALYRSEGFLPVREDVTLWRDRRPS
jgi:ribosomal protein S18 acetylase RimI-like enzyme